MNDGVSDRLCLTDDGGDGCATTSYDTSYCYRTSLLSCANASLTEAKAIHLLQSRTQVLLGSVLSSSVGHVVRSRACNTG